MKIGFVGLGNMGGPMCSRLAQAGYDVVAYDLRAEALEAVTAVGARRGDSAVDCASAVSVLVIDCTTTGAPPPTRTLRTRTA